jgi:two-component system response regulator AtoC
LTKILIVDDDPDILELLRLAISRSGCEVLTAMTDKEALDIIEGRSPEVAFVDIRLGKSSGLDLLNEIKRLYPDTTVIIMTGYQDMGTTIKAMQGGAFDYISKPIDTFQLIGLIEKAVEAKKIGIPSPEPLWHGTKEIVGKSRVMEEVYKLIGLASQNKATVLIQGETGTGKELIARAIHQYSPQKGKPFIAVNCSALTENLLESELFGHEKGAFTGATQRHRGKFEMADGGTIFLDEIGDIPLSIQVKLLRVLQEREFERVGGEETIRVDVRVVAATNRDMPKLVADGRFREDLYYRLKVITINLPPLRERKEDIPLLVDYFIGKSNSELHKEIKGVAPDVMNAFLTCYWKGNVRELENVVSRSVLMARGSVIFKEHIPELQATPAKVTVAGEDMAVRPLDEVEREAIERVLRFTNWNKSRACELLKIPRPRLDRKIKKYGLEP